MNNLAFYRSVDLLTRALPRRAAYAAAKAVSAWAFRHLPETRQVAASNLRVVLAAGGGAVGEDELARMVRATFDNFGKQVVDFFQSGRLSPRALDRLVKVEHMEYLEQCRGMGKGIIALSAHLGSWELGAAMMARQGCCINAVVRPQSSAKLDALFEARRRQRGIRILPLGGGAGLPLACLKRGELVVLLGDLNYSPSRQRVPFFGQPARLPRGPAVLAARTGAPILPAFVLREPDETFRLCLYPPIIPAPHCSIDDLRQRICAVLEDVIGNHPDQWFAFGALWQ